MRGRIVGEFQPEETDVYEVGHLMTGSEARHVEPSCRRRAAGPLVGRAWPGGPALRLMTWLAFVLFGVILLVSGKDPIQSYQDIFVSTLGSAYGFSEVIVAMIPMLITALAVALPSRVGLINVGGEGQLYIGACFATWGALTFSRSARLAPAAAR